jgi:hypothetical protein
MYHILNFVQPPAQEHSKEQTSEDGLEATQDLKRCTAISGTFGRKEK